MPSMNSGSFVTVSLFFVFGTIVGALDCSATTPIFVDLHNRAISGSNDFEYGFFIGIGTPSQNQSLWPSLKHNETTFTDTSYCSSADPVICKNSTHGFYDLSQSGTFKNNPNYSSLDLDDNVDSSVSATGTDVLNIYTHYFDPSPPNATYINDFPVTVLSNYSSQDDPFFGRGGALGLGTSSTVLQRLAGAGNILSRSFGLYLGTAYDRAGGIYNGSIVFGGYDAGRLTEPIYNYTMKSSTPTTSPFQLHINHITINFANGSNINLVDDAGFDAALTTSQYDLILPASVTTAFANALHATPANNNDNSLQLSASFSGTFSITLSSGQVITYPSTWLSNTSSLTPISATPLTNISSNFNTGPYSLGTAFLSELYLIASYSDTPTPENPGTFHLAPALPNALYVQTSPLCPNIPILPASTPSISHFAAAGLAGAIIGGIVGGSFLTILAWILIRKYILQPRLSSEKDASQAESGETEPGDYFTSKTWRQHDQQPGNASESSNTSLHKQRSNRLKRKLIVRFKSPQPSPPPALATCIFLAPDVKKDLRVTITEDSSPMELHTYPVTHPVPNSASLPMSLATQFASLPTPTSFETPLDSPMWPTTPTPLLSDEQRAQAHVRQGSDDLRRELGLKVVTSQMGQKGGGVREVGVGRGVGMKKSFLGVKIGEVPREGYAKGKTGRKESALRRIFPAS